MHVYFVVWTTLTETSLIRHSVGSESDVGLGSCRIMEGLLLYYRMVSVPHNTVGLERFHHIACVFEGLNVRYELYSEQYKCNS